MKESAHKTLVLAVSIIIMFIAGCEEEEKISDTKLDTQQDGKLDAHPDAKRSRLIAIENAQLKARIAKMKDSHTREMESQKNLHIKEQNRQKKLLDNCLRGKKGMEEMSTKGVENYMQNILGPIADENTKLQEENKALKEQIEKLKAELEEARK
jgi:cell division septum initiation protein DivIVA